MSIQNFIGPVVFAIFGSVFVKSFGIAITPNPYIEVHNLNYIVEEGVPYIVQDRTAESGNNGALVAKWEADVYVLNGPDLQKVCSGGAGSEYETGRVYHKMAFDYWVGEEGCFEKIPDGVKIKLHARHTWGAGEFREKWSDIIVVDKSIF